MMRKITSVFTVALASLVLSLGAANTSNAAGDAAELERQHWSFDGMTGTFDKNQLARGFLVFKTVCASCHGLNYVAFRDFKKIGFTDDELKAIIAEDGYEVLGEPDGEGEVAMRAARLSDYWPYPYANDKAAAAVNNGKAPPDLSLMAKARPNGPDYIYNLLTRYMDSTEENMKKLHIDGNPEDLILNAVYPGNVIAMSAPLLGDDVEYLDGTPTTVEQEAKDVTAFLMWTAEPKLEERKSMGIKVLIFLAIFTFLAFMMHRRLGHTAMKRQEEEGGPWED